jgi:anti-sigma factor RsiW
MLGGSGHLSDADLADLADGRAPPERRRAADAHVATCERCGPALAALQRLVATMRADRGEDAPPAVVAAVVRLFVPRARSERPAPLARALALLRFDSLGQPSALGVRAAGTAERQILFGADAHDIDLRVAPAGDRWAVRGQVLGPDGEGEVALIGAGGETRAPLDDLGEFAFAPAPPGRYRLVLRLGALEIETPELEIGA